MSPHKTLYLAMSLDVEEEGLFRGRYDLRNLGVTNTAELTRLLPLLEHGIRPTLFCAHSVLTDAASCHILETLRDKYKAEIGAHLHHWNTPPLYVEGHSQLPEALHSVPASLVPLDILQAKLETLLQAGKIFQGANLTSFRMGRWDWHKEHWPLLASLGVLCDASVRPLHTCLPKAKDPDHFDAPSAPYWVQTPVGSIFEVPLTVTPVLDWTAQLLRSWKKKGFLANLVQKLEATMHCWGALALLPAYHPLWLMQLMTRLYVAKGGSLLSLTWHSSEMQPGATPHLPDENSVQKLLKKISSFLTWLDAHWQVCCLPMSELRTVLGAKAPLLSAKTGDWTTSAEFSQ